MSVKLQHPLPGRKQTAAFGWRPAFIENGVYIPAMLHDGADIGAPEGTPILAAHAGRVTFVGWWNDSAGWTVRIGSAFGSTVYCHQSGRSPLVNPGDEVRAGQPIGYVGQSGMATGAHLHFMLETGQGWIDPMPYVKATPKPTPKPEPAKDIDMRVIYNANDKNNETRRAVVGELTFHVQGPSASSYERKLWGAPVNVNQAEWNSALAMVNDRRAMVGLPKLAGVRGEAGRITI